MRKREAALPQAKLIRLLNLINQLKVTPMTIEEIERNYDVSKRTAYRYVGILELCDIQIEQDFENRYYVIK